MEEALDLSFDRLLMIMMMVGAVTPVCCCGCVDILSCLRYGWQISHHTIPCHWDTELLFVLHVMTSMATKRSSHLLNLPRTGSYPLTPAQNQVVIILTSAILLPTTLHSYLSQIFTASQFCLIVHLILFIIPARH